MTIRIQRLPQVLHSTGQSRSTLYGNVGKGLWTKPVKIGARSTGWPEHEVERLNAARISGMTEEQIRDLVSRLEAARKDLAQVAA